MDPISAHRDATRQALFRRKLAPRLAVVALPAYPPGSTCPSSNEIGEEWQAMNVTRTHIRPKLVWSFTKVRFRGDKLEIKYSRCTEALKILRSRRPLRSDRLPPPQPEVRISSTGLRLFARCPWHPWKPTTAPPNDPIPYAFVTLFCTLNNFGLPFRRPHYLARNGSYSACLI